MKMEIDSTVPEVVSKKMLHLLRIVFYMLKTGISKSKLMVDLNLMVKRGNKLAGKAIDNLLTFHHHHRTSAFSCVSDSDSLNFVSPREYEFSCSNTPVINFIPHRRNNHHNNYHHNVRHFARSHYRYDDAAKTVAAVQKMLEMLNSEATVAAAAAAASPAVSLPGFGKNSPAVRQLRITDSPFMVKDEGSDLMVDKKAEEFIKKFYKDLKLQKSRAAIESPEPYVWVR